ncbi:alcohol dehydrogenase catalytic domain-containing protein [Irregularibacter muris]|uniref:Alcohol dehydrogenase catalytic domain-containing protein n=1 Tax=Irregularibacter muris TaxID=1796619 RepID=A0AAE3L2C7_9FIRM|nr:alcohol dehydrogenase catalytic domain-containing protein [Irregularibacter muris]MCR1898274.1 alcohol dehydrogenase catalytic domain-containing protein [Irregularibacter muris]
MKTMKTAVFHGVKKLVIEDAPYPEVPENKILIRVEACALCTWEQRVYTGVKEVDFPFIGGHEIAGKIVDIGDKVDKRAWAIGDKVVHGTFGSCGNCYHCKTGNEQNCLHFDHSKHLEGLPYKGMGGLTQYMLADPKHLFKYKNISPEEAALTEPLSAVIHSVETADIQFGDTVVVIGCGIMGQLHINLALKRGAIVIASDMNEERTALAKKLGAHYTINPSKEELKKVVMKVTDGIGAQAVFNTTPIDSVVQEGIDALGNTAKLVLYSSFYPDNPVAFSPDTLHKKATQILGTANSNSKDFMKATKMMSEGIVDVKPFISEVYDLKDIVKAFDSSIKGDKYRVVIRF